METPGPLLQTVLTRGPVSSPTSYFLDARSLSVHSSATERGMQKKFMCAVPRPDIRTHFHFMTRTCQTRRLCVDVQCRSGTGHIEVQSRRPFPLAFCPFPGAYVPKTIYHRVRKDFGGLSLRRTAKRGPVEIISKTPLLTTNNAARYVSCDKKRSSISSPSLELLPGNSNYARISEAVPSVPEFP